MDPQSYSADIAVRVKRHPQAGVDEFAKHVDDRPAPSTIRSSDLYLLRPARRFRKQYGAPRRTIHANTSAEGVITLLCVDFAAISEPGQPFLPEASSSSAAEQALCTSFRPNPLILLQPGVARLDSRERFRLTSIGWTLYRAPIFRLMYRRMRWEDYLEQSARGDEVSPYHLEAAIAAEHACARTLPWRQLLLRFDDNYCS